MESLPYIDQATVPSSNSIVTSQVSHVHPREESLDNVGNHTNTAGASIDTCANDALRSRLVNSDLVSINCANSILTDHELDIESANSRITKNTHSVNRINGIPSTASVRPLSHLPPLAMDGKLDRLEMDPNESIDCIHRSNGDCDVTVQESSQRSYDDKDVTCGLCSLRCPSFIESKFANKKTFLVIFCITSVLQGMYQTYFVSILTTIEKLYQIQSKTIGIIMSATEISQIIGSLFLTYYAGQGNRPKWIGIGILVFAVSSLLTSAPHFIFRDHSNEFSFESLSPVAHSPSSLWNGSRDLKLGDHKRRLCNLDGKNPFSSYSKQSCTEESAESRTQSQVTTTVLIIFFLSRFMIGIGATALNTLGISFLDDNVAPKESPLYFGKLTIVPMLSTNI